MLNFIFLYFEKLKKQNSISELFFVFLGQIIAAAGSVIGVRLLTHRLSPESYGEVSLALTVGVLFQQLLFGPLSNSYLRFFSAARELDELQGFFNGVKKSALKSILYSLLVFIVFIFVLFLIDWKNYLSLVFFSFLFLLITSVNQYLDNLQNAARQRVVVAWHQGLGSWLRYLLAFGIILIFGPNSQNAAIGFALSAACVLFSQLIFLRRTNLFVSEREKASTSGGSVAWERKIWSYAFPFMSWGIFTWMQMSSDKWALNIFSSTSDVGLFTVLYQLGYYPISFLSTILLQFFSPIIFQNTGNGNQLNKQKTGKQKIVNLVVFSLVMGTIAFLLALLLHQEIFTLFVPSQYRTVSFLLPWMVLSGCLFMSGQFASIHFLAAVTPEKLFGIKTITALLGIGFNFGFCFLWGLRGIVFASLSFSVIYFMSVLVKMRAEPGENGGNSSIS